MKVLACRMSFVAALMLGSSIVALALQGPDPFLGTWKLNVARTKYDPPRAPAATLIKYEPAVGGLKQVTDGVESTVIIDGKDHPISGNANADTMAFTRPDPHTLASVWKKNGKVTITATNVVSADGKTRTITQKGTDAQGRAVNTVIVYDRQ